MTALRGAGGADLIEIVLVGTGLASGIGFSSGTISSTFGWRAGKLCEPVREVVTSGLMVGVGEADELTC